MFTIIYTDSYLSRATRFFKRYPSVLKPYKKTLSLLEMNPFHPSLRLHKLSGKLDALYSISINLSYRIILTMLVRNKEIVLVDIGDHDSVY